MQSLLGTWVPVEPAHFPLVKDTLAEGLGLDPKDSVANANALTAGTNADGTLRWLSVGRVTGDWVRVQSTAWCVSDGEEPGAIDIDARVELIHINRISAATPFADDDRFVIVEAYSKKFVMLTSDYSQLP